MPNRRDFLKLSAFTAGSVLLPRWSGRLFADVLPGGTLPPSSIPKYVRPLVIPPVMPKTGRVVARGGRIVDYYEIAVRQFEQQILPPGMPSTTVWSYGSANHPATFNYPAFTIEAREQTGVRVKWMNQLTGPGGSHLPHLLPVDPTLHWANPPGGVAGRDGVPTFQTTPGPYTGPVPMVTHVHGAHTFEYSDGYPEAWYLPNASDIPAEFANRGSKYDEFKAKFEAAWGQPWQPGSAVFQYPNDQRATTLWYHDHTLGMTRLNVYAGPAGFYLLRGGRSDVGKGVLPGPAPSLGDAPGTKYFEIPIAIQDRSFNLDGSLFYPDSRTFFDEFGGPYVPESDIPPLFNPEFFANTMVVNGNTWPVLEVEPRRYRFRFLNGCNSRFLILKLSENPLEPPETSVLPFWQIGSEGGFLPKPVKLNRLLMGLAERADVIVDFTGVPRGTELYLVNEGPDEPFNGLVEERADPESTGQVMKFVVGRLTSPDATVPPQHLHLPRFEPLGVPERVRRVSLNEVDSEVLEDVGPQAALLGTVDEDGNPMAMKWMDEVTENPAVGATEEWEIYNFTADAHPIHVHLVQFQVVNRERLATDEEGMSLAPAQLTGEKFAPEPGESGYKDTVISYPGQVTRIKAKFDMPGQFVWHCHIVEHEDNEMMRAYRVG